MKLKGYIFSRDFFGERVPQNVQNIVLRDYCKKNKHTFLLSGTEYTFKKSSYILFEILEKLNNYDGILFYSLYQLPEDKEKRKEFFKKIIHKKKQIHFTLENIILKNMKDVDYVEKIFLLKQSIISDKNTGSSHSSILHMCCLLRYILSYLVILHDSLVHDCPLNFIKISFIYVNGK